MKALFICKASINTGLGHLVRSKTLAAYIKKESTQFKQVDFISIGDTSLEKLLLSDHFSWKMIEQENDLNISDNYDVIFFDMMNIQSDIFLKIKQQARLTVSLSPMFNMLNFTDILFNRTKYLVDSKLPKEIYAGMEYSIIQPNCKKINTDIFQSNLNLPFFPIAISMGGTDAANKTLKCLQALKKCSVPAVFWVALGEGYSYSYDELINEIKSNTSHEIILVHSNRSMWHILQNCVFLILMGGITSYEAAHAGLPSINFLETNEHYFLIREIVENNACFYGDIFSEKNLLQLNEKIEDIFANKNELFNMHLQGKSLMDHNACAIITRIVTKKLRK
ncbi:MAG: hypothetical protein A2381_00965 [Bdellovibrionales bacterium RIFOXYB1_FULL_37_110]|nr:MAG: hypothetical protein A2417_01820 [Bdellovibrionales bacterium RIFOXYC1_FULL_37_79]OFZ58789.1 MAG: hypothetical protein A2381_00965 [Bdellovibrionales bacterium RIFOXYB1_FULL_37_110]OFZ64788.1 MAG: hypothetical protein A2577_06965 [Bdellovibrionales bacterium RIFOXYD1_FULL_36_51]